MKSGSGMGRGTFQHHSAGGSPDLVLCARKGGTKEHRIAYEEEVSLPCYTHVELGADY